MSELNRPAKLGRVVWESVHKMLQNDLLDRGNWWNLQMWKYCAYHSGVDFRDCDHVIRRSGNLYVYDVV